MGEKLLPPEPTSVRLVQASARVEPRGRLPIRVDQSRVFSQRAGRPFFSGVMLLLLLMKFS